MGFYVRYVAFVLNLLSRTWIGLPSPYEYDEEAAFCY